MDQAVQAPETGKATLMPLPTEILVKIAENCDFVGGAMEGYTNGHFPTTNLKPRFLFSPGAPQREEPKEFYLHKAEILEAMPVNRNRDQKLTPSIVPISQLKNLRVLPCCYTDVFYDDGFREFIDVVAAHIASLPTIEEVFLPNPVMRWRGLDVEGHQMAEADSNMNGRIEGLKKLPALRRLVVQNSRNQTLRPVRENHSDIAAIYLDRLPTLEEVCVGFYHQNGATIFAPVRETDAAGRTALKDVRLIDSYEIDGCWLPVRDDSMLTRKDVSAYVEPLVPRLDDLVGDVRRKLGSRL
ncbi:hypothetical protein OQA88_7132 [Cercophora sp. LCS_1]